MRPISLGKHGAFVFTTALVMALSMAACMSAPLELSLGRARLTIAQGQASTLMVTVPNAGEAVTVSLKGAPSGLSAEPLTIAKGESGGLLTIRASDAAAVGSTSVTIEARSDGKLATQGLELSVVAPGTGDTIATGLNGPMGVLVDPQGNVWAVDSGTGGEDVLTTIDPETGQPVTAKYGDTARVVEVTPAGAQHDVAFLPSLRFSEETTGASRLALLDGKLYVTNLGWNAGSPQTRLSEFAAVVRIDGGTTTEVANTWDLENAQNPDPYLKDTHPYGLAALGGKLYVADAGGNDVLSVDPATGEVSLVAVLEGVPASEPNPNRGGKLEADPVPTGITAGPDGNLYVAILPGNFAPGGAKIFRLAPSGELSTFASGLTAVTDVQTAPDGNLYAVEIFTAFGPNGPTPSGQVVRVRQDGSLETLLSGLAFPTAIAFNAEGDAFVTTGGIGAPGSGQVVRFDNLTSRLGF